MPARRRRGLSSVLLTEGLRQLQRMGATATSVASGGPAANALYESWVRQW